MSYRIIMLATLTLSGIAGAQDTTIRVPATPLRDFIAQAALINSQIPGGSGLTGHG